MNAVSPIAKPELEERQVSFSGSLPFARPELLAPAGDWECARAAVENGADAIYFGLERFNARMRARNFTEADLPKLMEFLHGRGVRGYVTLNTLVFPEELAEAEQHIRAVVAAGVDAAIVQDIGVCRLIRSISPDFPIHASTQMTITSAAGVEFARELGCELVVLARECAVREIEQIRQSATTSGSDRALPLEVFIHGALCVAYSGQCLTSEALGGRSANRGECAQACRMPYELVSDGQTVALGDKRYLLSPQDLAGLEVLPDLIRAGVSSLKIEGRLKSPEYVASITRVYRRALDRVFNEASKSLSSASPASNESAHRLVSDLQKQSGYEMEMAFSRGLFTGWFRGIDNQKLVHARFGKKRGVFLGEVTRVDKDSVYLKRVAPVKPGDGVVFDSGHPDQDEEGGRVYAVHPHGSESRLEFGRHCLNLKRIHPGDKLWKTNDPELDRELRQTFRSDQIHFRRPLRFAAHGQAGTPLTVIARDELGHAVQVQSTMPLVLANRQPLTAERLAEQFGRLGGTPFFLEKLDVQLAGDLILPMRELNRLRRDAVAELQARRAQTPRWQIHHEPLDVIAQNTADATPAPAGSSQLIVLVRNLHQLRAVLDHGVETIYCEFEDPKKYREAVSLFREHPARSETSRNPSTRAIYVAPPRIFKPGEDWILKIVQSSEPDGYLVRNYDHLKTFSGSRCVGDFSLNVANRLTAEYLINRFELEHVTASYDLNAAQLESLLRSAPPTWFEITIHQHMPMFHMEHCVFCAFLSTGADYRNCGRPCDQHDVKLRDRIGAEHPLKADAGCRNTVFNALAQTGAEAVPRFLALGARRFRIEFLNETADQIELTLSAYQKLFRHEITGTQLWRELKVLNQLGVTRGTSASVRRATD